MLLLKDGFAVCHDLKNHPSTKSIPVLILNSLDSSLENKRGTQVLAKGHKVDGYLEKPVDLNHLKTEVQVLLSESDKQEEKRQKVLLIDDDPDFCEAIQTILSDKGFQVITSHTGEDGIHLAETENPDIVLLDVVLPEMDGFAACKYLKENIKTEPIPIVMLTSIGSRLTEPDYAKAIAVTHHADDYLEKPVASSVILKVIRSYIGPARGLV